MKTIFVFLLLLSLGMASCQTEGSLEGFDDKTWREDANACGNKRGTLLKSLLDKKEALKKLDDDAISALLGKPERNRQFARGKKNYIYFIYPGKQCQGDTTGKEGKKLVVEFDSIGGVSIIRESNLDF